MDRMCLCAPLRCVFCLFLCVFIGSGVPPGKRGHHKGGHDQARGQAAVQREDGVRRVC